MKICKKWTKEDDAVLNSNLKPKKIAVKLGRTLFAVYQRRSALRYMGMNVSKPVSATERAKTAWKTRKANLAKGNTNKPTKQGKVLKSKSDFKFILNGIPVTIGVNVKNAHVGVDRIEVNF